MALELTNGPVDAQRPADAALEELLARARQSSVVFFDEFSDVVAEGLRGLTGHNAEEWRREHKVDLILSRLELDGDMIHTPGVFVQRIIQTNREHIKVLDGLVESTGEPA